MMTTSIRSVLLLTALSLASLHAEPVTLKNSQLVVTVDPGLGRITEFRSPGDENLMCLEKSGTQKLKTPGTDYAIHGGERISPTQAFIWRYTARDPGPPERYNFLPDETIDGQPWKVTASTADSITWQSGRSAWLGVVATRTLALDPKEAIVKIETSFQRVAPSPVPLQVWSISMVRTPESCLLGIDDTWRHTPFAWTELSRPGRLPAAAVHDDGPAIAFTIPAQPDHPKVGAMGSWIAGVYPHEIFLQVIETDPAGGYPDDSSVQAYADDGFVEMETLSSIASLKVGETLRSTMVWQLIPRPASGNLSTILDRHARELLSDLLYTSAPSKKETKP